MYTQHNNKTFSSNNKKKRKKKSTLKDNPDGQQTNLYIMFHLVYCDDGCGMGVCLGM